MQITPVLHQRTTINQHHISWCREAPAVVSKSDSMPPALAFNGAVLHSEHVLPPPRPAFGQVQDTALQHDASANSSNRHSQPHGLHTSSSYDHTASVNSADHFTFPPSSHHMNHSSLGNTSEVSPPGRRSLSDGIPPAFETNSSCGASAAALSPIPGRLFATPHMVTGMFPLRLHTAAMVNGTLYLTCCCCCVLHAAKWGGKL